MSEMSTLSRQTGQRSTPWWSGFENLLRKESYEWWGTRRWIQQAELWLVVCNGFSILLMFAMPALLTMSQEAGGAPVIDPIDAGINLFLIASMTGISVGMALIGQGQVIDEILLGTVGYDIFQHGVCLTAVSKGNLVAVNGLIHVPHTPIGITAHPMEPGKLPRLEF